MGKDESAADTEATGASEAAAAETVDTGEDVIEDGTGSVEVLLSFRTSCPTIGIGVIGRLPEQFGVIAAWCTSELAGSIPPTTMASTSSTSVLRSWFGRRVELRRQQIRVHQPLVFRGHLEHQHRLISSQLRLPILYQLHQCEVILECRLQTVGHERLE